jgi:type I restriction enzyme S subunit
MSGWEIKKLSEVCQIKPPKEEARRKLTSTDLVSFVPMSDLGIQTKTITLNENKPLSEVAGSYTYFANNDVLLAKITPCFENGKLGIADNLTNGVGFGSSEYIVFRSKGAIEPEYLFYFLSQSSFRNSGARVMTGAVGHKRIPKDFIENYSIPLPSLAEQKRIVSIVDNAFEGIDRAIDNTKKNLTNARELFESYLNAAFTQKDDGWAEKKLGDIATFRNGLNFTKNSKGESIKIVGVKDFQNNFWIHEEQLDSVTLDGDLREIDILRKGDILTVRSNGNKELIGRCVLIGDLSGKTSHSGFTIRIRIEREDIHLPYIVHFLKSRELRKQLVECGGGINISSLNQQGLSLITMRFPSFAEQKAIVADINEIATETQRLEAIYYQKLAALNELKQTILQKAFIGELTADTTNQTTKTAEEVIAA